MTDALIGDYSIIGAVSNPAGSVNVTATNSVQVKPFEDGQPMGIALSGGLFAGSASVVDVRIDPDEASPLLKRFESLISQGNSKNVAGWEA